MTDYRTSICRLFTRYGVPFQAEEVNQALEAPWLELHELVDLDEASGHPVVTVRLGFHGNASSAEPQPSVPDVALYAQHQHAVQDLLAAHDMAAWPWPSLVYTGSTAFESIFPERLALNRDLVFLAYAERRALWRYARVLQQTSRTLAALATMSSPPSVSRLVAAARHATVMPLLDRRLGTMTANVSSKALQRQIATLRTEMPSSLLERLQTFPAFADASAYFRAIVEALRPRLDAPSGEIPRLPEEVDAPPRPERRRQRRVTTPRHDD